VGIKVYVLSLRTSNWRSVYQAVLLGGNEPTAFDLREIDKIEARSVVIFPGVGNVSSLAEEIRCVLSPSEMRKWIESKEIRIIGICLGFQFLFSRSLENPLVECLGIFPSEVKPVYKVLKPSVGWEGLVERYGGGDRNDLDLYLSNNKFYFTHTFGAIATEIDKNFGKIYSYLPASGPNEIVAAVMYRNYVGYQFHPEKSGMSGIRLLAASIKYLSEI
jgi:imidazole glycerol phosphate synthase glutamine amidotransferase subunit